jgi:phosphoglycerate kinase
MIRSVKDIDVRGKRVLVRLDLDVPVSDAGDVEDVTRLEAALPTLQHLTQNGATVVVLGHAGRPEGEVVSSLSLRPILAKLMELLGNTFTYQIIDEPQNLALEGTIFALENLRFHKGEEENDAEFVSWLASFGDIFVNDAFAVSHRAHASTFGLAERLPAYAGLHLLEEVEQLQEAMAHPIHPVAVVLGGAKVETKLPAITNMDAIADHILLGGKLVQEADKTHLSAKVVLGKLDQTGFDIDEDTRKQFADILAQAKTIIWNGPVGKFEEVPYDAGTKAVAEAIAANTAAHRVVGGGDTLESLRRFGLLTKVGYVSTGGGAMLDFLAGEELPGLKALGLYAS